MIATILCFGGIKVVLGQLSIGALVTFNIFSQKFITPITSIYRFPTEILDYKLSWSKIKQKIIETEILEDTGEDIASIDKITFNEVGFKYNDILILEKCEFQLKTGNMYALVGASGSGKSTIFKILQKQEIATEGEVQLNNKNILDITDSTYYSKIGFATQDTGIFTASIKDNISLFDNKPVDKTIIEQLGLNTLINSKPKGIDTVISSEDKSISGGEKQRIAIARLLNENFDCILLDESTSSLDKNSVDIVEECILSKKDLTVIAITHHLTSKAIEMSDFILKLEDGKLVPVTM